MPVVAICLFQQADDILAGLNGFRHFAPQASRALVEGTYFTIGLQEET